MWLDEQNICMASSIRIHVVLDTLHYNFEIESHLYIVQFGNGIHLACNQGSQLHH
jgi:hypothetical protein